VIVSRGLGLGLARGAIVAVGLGLLGVTAAPGGTIATRGLGLSPYHGAMVSSGLGVGEAPTGPATGPGGTIVTRGLGLTPYHGALSAQGLGLGEAVYTPTTPTLDPYEDAGADWGPARKKKAPAKMPEVAVLDLTLARMDDRDLMDLMPIITRMLQ
jgi:hypothetical protein